MESTELEKQVENILATPQFEQPAFDQTMSGTIKNIFLKRNVSIFRRHSNKRTIR